MFLTDFLSSFCCSYENLTGLVENLGLKLPKLHRTDDAGWDFACSLAAVAKGLVTKQLKSVPFFSLSYDESTSEALESVLSLAAHYWHPGKGPGVTYLSMSELKDTTASGLKDAVCKELERFNVLDLAATSLVGCGSDGANVMLGVQNGLSIQIAQSLAPFSLAVHCPAHRVALVGKELLDVPDFLRVRDFTKRLWNHFTHSAKRKRAFLAIAKSVIGKELTVLQPHEIRWLSLSQCVSRIRDLYPALLRYFKEIVDATMEPGSKALYDDMTDLSFLLLLEGFDVLLGELASMSRLFQSCDYPLVSVPAHVKTTADFLQKHFERVQSAFQCERTWKRFHVLTVSADPPLQWEDDCLVYVQSDSAHAMLAVDPGKRGRPHAEVVDTSEFFDRVVASVKKTLQAASKKIRLGNNLDDFIFVLCSHVHILVGLLERFPRDVVASMGILQPSYWADTQHSTYTFEKDLESLIEVYGAPKTVGGMNVHPLVDGDALGTQAAFFQELMLSSAKNMTSTTDFWLYVDNNPQINGRIREFQRLAHIVLSLPLGSVTNERDFSLLNLTVTPLRSKLSLDKADGCLLVKRCQKDLESFPFNEAYEHWKSICKRYGV